MKTEDKIRLKEYSKLEEGLNILTHGFGILMAVIGLVAMIDKSLQRDDILVISSVIVFGSSMIVLYTASTLYHSSRKKEIRYKLNILDHAAIFVLIAGTYTPFTLITLKGTLGWVIFSVVWLVALVGVILKLKYTGRYKRLSTIMYVLMGWIVVAAMSSLIKNLEFEALLWLFGGGLSYTIGAVLFSIHRMPLNHAIFHLFVLGGSFCHLYTVYYFVI